MVESKIRGMMTTFGGSRTFLAATEIHGKGLLTQVAIPVGT